MYSQQFRSTSDNQQAQKQKQNQTFGNIVSTAINKLQKKDNKYTYDSIMGAIKYITEHKNTTNLNKKYIQKIANDFKNNKITADQLVADIESFAGTPEANINKLVDDFLKSKQIQGFKIKKGLDVLKGEISAPLRALTSETSSLHEILEKVISEIIKDKVEIKQINDSKFEMERELGTIKEKMNNFKVGYKRLTEENSKLYDVNAQIIDENERLKTKLFEEDTKNKQYQELTTDLIDRKKAVRRKVDSFTNMLSKIDNKMGYQLKDFLPSIKPADFDSLVQEQSGGSGKQSKYINSIMKKLKVEKDMLVVLSALYNKKVKKRTELFLISQLLDLNLKPSTTKQVLLENILKKLKPLSKTEVEFLKKYEFNF